MVRPFDDTTRRNIAELCAGFARLPESAPESASVLKRAAVAIVLVEADAAADGAAFVLTRRASSLRSHRGQWALPGGRCDTGETAVVGKGVGGAGVGGRGSGIGGRGSNTTEYHVVSARYFVLGCRDGQPRKAKPRANAA